jgi:hypothetical protein
MAKQNISILNSRRLLPGVSGALTAMLCAMSFILAADAAPIAGKYDSPQLSLEIVADGARFTGTIHLGQQTFPLMAQMDGSTLRGTFASGGNNFAFTAMRDGDVLTFITGGTTYKLSRKIVNPLAAGGSPINPLADLQAKNAGGNVGANPGAADAHAAGFDMLAGTATGEALETRKPGAKSAQLALSDALPGLAKIFGAPPTIVGAFADDKDSQAGASFTATLGGKPIKGMAICGVDDTGAIITIIYDQADAPPMNFAVLTAALPAPLVWEDQIFPDKTGSTTLPADWQITGSTSTTFDAVGPGGQTIDLGLSYSIETPDVVKQLDTQIQTAKLVGAAPRLMVAPFTGPVDAIKNLTPIFSNLSVQDGGQPIKLDQIIEFAPIALGDAAKKGSGDAGGAGGDTAPAATGATKVSALVHYSWVRGEGPSAVEFQSLALVTTSSIGQGAWSFDISYISAPAKIFERNLAEMIDIWKCRRSNDKAELDHLDAALKQMKQTSAMVQAAAQTTNTADATSNWTTSHDNPNANFNAIVLSYRHDEDSLADEQGNPDPTNLHDFLAKLNGTSDPPTYREVRLRGE